MMTSAHDHNNESSMNLAHSKEYEK